MEKVMMLPPEVQQNLGNIDIDAILSQRRVEKAKWLEENKSRLIEQYGVTEDFSDFELLKIRDCEKTALECEKCTGLPCLKDREKAISRTIKVDVARKRIDEYFGTCKYEKARRSIETAKRNFKSARISTDYLGKSFSDYKIDTNNREAVKVAKEILSGKERGAYFYGAFGTGKTFLSAIIANEFVKGGVGVLFYKVPFLVKDLQDAMFDKSDKFLESRLLKKICEVPVLILDDCGMSGKISTYAAGRLSMIIDARYENSKLVTVITSNLSIDALQDKLDKPSDAADAFTLDGSRIADRLKEMCAVVELGGESRRRRK